MDNNLNPKWVKHFTLDYLPHEHQQLRFEVWDEDMKCSELIGACDIFLREIMNAPNRKFSSALVHKKDLRGTLEIKADLVSSSNDFLQIHFFGSIKSRKFLCCGADNPYLLIERARLLTEEELAEREKVNLAHLVPLKSRTNSFKKKEVQE